MSLVFVGFLVVSYNHHHHFFTKYTYHLVKQKRMKYFNSIFLNYHKIQGTNSYLNYILYDIKKLKFHFKVYLI